VRRLATRSLLAGCLAAAACASPRPPGPAAPPAAAPAPAARTLEVTATAYNATPEQTSGDPHVGAWGHRLEPGTKAVAVSPDLLDLGLGPEREIRIDGLEGTWRVLDKMPARWTRRIDLFMGRDVEAAKQWGERRVRITWD
jgi:3D (Asp-Asp-Asp) domain-containing protein